MPLAPGQTNIQQNAEFDSRILARGAVDGDGFFISPSKTSLYRGRVETADMYNGYTWRLQFLFNPTSFTHSGQIDPNVNLKAAKDNPDYKGSSAAFQEIQQNIGFSLLFDRTYEVWNKSNPSVSEWGVLADIKAMYALFGMYDDITSDSGAAATSYSMKGLDANSFDQMSPTAPMQWRPVWVIFGPTTKYYGVINSFNITYTHFSQKMTPVRAAIDMNLQMIPISDPGLAAARERAMTPRQKVIAHQDRMLGKQAYY